MLRFVIVPRQAREATDMLRRARVAAADLDRESEIVLVLDDTPAIRRWSALVVPELRTVNVRGASDDAGRLDAALVLRPLPDDLVIVGRDSRCSAAQLCFLAELVASRRGPTAATTDGDLGPDVAPLLEHGAAVLAGPTCQAGGFEGDRMRSLHDRLDAAGFSSVVLPSPRPVAAVGARRDSLVVSA